ncbi:MAG: hypothetical protein IJ583_00540 [Firmicutes bacterium]|nr:hypothetical protein [Bacillota bacterium]
MKKFELKDIIFLAILAAVATLFGGLAMPVMRSEIFGIQTLVTSPFYALFAAIGIMKVKKIGTLSVFGLFTGFPLLFMSPVMFFNNFAGGVLAEIVTILVFKGYNAKTSVICAAALWMILTVPISLPFSLWFNGSSLERFRNTALPQTILVCVGIIILSVTGAAIGLKISDELKKAGKIK